MWESTKELFTFPRRQRNGIIVLLILIFLVLVIKFTLPYWANRHAAFDTEAYEQDIAAFEAQLEPLSAQPDSFSININTATATDLTTIKGIGPATAKAIVAYRDSLGGLTHQDQLLNVAGIGPATLQRIIPYIYFSTDSTIAN